MCTKHFSSDDKSKLRETSQTRGFDDHQFLLLTEKKCSVLSTEMLRLSTRCRTAFLSQFAARLNFSNQVFLLKHQKCTADLKARAFSNEAFKEALNKVKRDREEEEALRGENVKPLDPEENPSKEKTDTPKEDSETKVNVAELKFKAFTFMRDAREFLSHNFKEAWGEMTGSSKESVLERKFEQSQSFRRAKDSTEDDDQNSEDKERYDGPSALVVVPAAKSYWEQMASRLDAPIIREILKGAKVYTKAAADTDIGKQAQKATQNVRDKIEDAREFWETSQNPVIHTLSGVWENMTGDTEEGLTISEIRKKDPGFVKENWTEEVKRVLAPTVIKAHLEGDTKALKPWLTEGVFARLSAEIRARKADGIVFDSNILEIDENAVVLKFLENGGAVILVVYMVQQINCIRNKKGEVIEVRKKTVVIY